jgi:hypothetical protein
MQNNLTENKSFTENGDPALSTSGNKCLDFFVRIVRNAPIDDVIESYKQAFIEDQKMALQILFNLRDARNGKGEKQLVYAIVTYLRFVLPKEVHRELFQQIIKYGYWKDVEKIEDIYCRLIDNRDDTIINMFVDQLREDQKILDDTEMKKSFVDITVDEKDEMKITDKEIKTASISLCAKWAPSEWSTYNNKHNMMAKRITEALFPNQQNGKERSYRKLLTRLRNHLNILEMLMSTGKFDRIDFSKIPATAIRKTRKAFERSCNAEGKEIDARAKLKVSYEEFLKKLSENKTKVKSAGTAPHELVKYYFDGGEHDQLIESQWDQIKERVIEAGVFKNTVAIVDVSGSMQGGDPQPIEVSIALGILLAECCEGVFKGKMISFHTEPDWHHLKGETLKEKVNCVKGMKWGGSTALFKVFDLLLKEAQIYNLELDRMIDKIFIFTDMQMDALDEEFMNSKGRGTFERCKEKFEKAGYKFPKIVCWNLRTSQTKTLPVDQNAKDYVMLSGFSSELLKCILTGKDFNPLAMMKHVIEPYDVPEALLNCKADHTKAPDLDKLKEVLTAVVPKNTFKKDTQENNKITPSIRGRGGFRGRIRGRGRGRF